MATAPIHRTAPPRPVSARAGIGPYDRGVAETRDERQPGFVAGLLALLIDWMALLLMIVVAGLLALGWLLLRTQAGRYDAPAGDALVAAALIGATAPAWTAWQAGRMYLRGATFGQARLGLAVEGGPRRRVARLLLHPVSAPLWAWLTATVLVGAGLVYAALAILVVVVVYCIELLGGGIGLIMMNVWRRRSWRALMPGDWRTSSEILLGTRVVRRP